MTENFVSISLIQKIEQYSRYGFGVFDILGAEPKL